MNNRQPNISVEELLNLVAMQQIAKDKLSPEILKAIKRGFDTGAFNAKVSSLRFQLSDPKVQNVLNKVAEKTNGIAGTTIEELSRKVNDVLLKGGSSLDIEKVIKQYFTHIKSTRVPTIAQTMTTSGFEGGQQVAFDTAGIDKKKWLTQRDGSVRHSHIEADGQLAVVGGGFQVGSSVLEYPGDPNGQAKEVINCRCSMLPVIT
ncbi:MAG: hypothetical protein RIE52_11940 [Balneola sp.]